MVPADININDLNSACTNRWRNAKFVLFIIKITIINLIWLKVENAIIFFKSNSIIAIILPINIVVTETIIIIVLKFLLIVKGSIRINKITPAVTSVDEWTKEDTGVGAAIALGSHVEKGNWALLVKAARVIIIIVILDSSIKLNIDHDPILNINTPAIINAISPIRFKINVIIPKLYT